MDIDDERIREAVRHTEILRAPKQNLATFWHDQYILLSGY